MKIIILPVIFFILFLQQTHVHGQTLVKIGSTNISKQEFVKAFRKNNTEQVANEKATKEYLELFIRFKLKVRAAFDARLDTLPAQKAELADFKSQLAESYIVDENSFRALVNEAVERSRRDIHLAHIFIPFTTSPGRKEGDTAYAAKRAAVAYDLLVKGNDFGKVAADFSADTATRNNSGDLGFVTVFTLPYAFENVAYSMAPGSFSKPFKSVIGYHIFKNTGEREAAGAISVAQVLFAFEPNPTDSTIKAIANRADSVYTALKKGASFNEMVTRYSNDNTSINVHGELAAFTPGTYSPAFEESAFSLGADNEIGKPFRTAFGYHILKRLALIKNEYAPDADSSMTVLQDKIKKNERMEVSRKALLKKIYTAINFKPAPFDKNAFAKISDSVMQNRNYTSVKGITKQSVIFTTGDQKRLMQEWLKYLADVQNIASLSMGKSVPELYQQFQDNAATDYYREHLDLYNSDYAAQLEEFREGNLLFEMMQETVWDKAAKDSSGMRAFFNKNKTRYTWEPSVDAIIFSAVDSVSANGLWKELAKGINNWKNSLVSYLDKAQGDSGRYEISQLPISQSSLVQPPQLTMPAKNAGNSDTYSFVYIIREHPGNTPKTFAEAQGAVLNDYQQFLEDQWIAKLRQKYPVTINQSVLKTLW